MIYSVICTEKEMHFTVNVRAVAEGRVQSNKKKDF